MKNPTKKVMTFFALGTIMFSMLQAPVHAVAGQWSANGNSIYYMDGSLGIGSTNPAGKFTVVGNDSSVNTTILKLGNLDARNWHFVAAKYQHNAYGDYALVLSQPAYSGGCANACRGDLVLQPGRNTVINTGNVAIGTNNPGNYKLAVNGTIKAKEIVVSMNNWADYVFEDDYKLLPLNDVKSFIEANKHLPGIPSAKNIESSNLPIGEMQRLQMEKIEELTLHLIEKDEEIGELEERLERLEYLVSLN